VINQKIQMDRHQIPKILNFSATDPSGGAGMNADIMTQTSLGCHPLSVVTGVTVQDTNGVDYVSPIDAEIVNDQARKILKDSDIDVIKCGLLCSTENIVMLSQITADYPQIPVILDPIITSGMGDQLSTQDMLESMINLLFPKATLITPNINEARILSSFNQKNKQSIDVDQIALRLMATGCQNILITGGDDITKSIVNRFYNSQNKNEPKIFHWERIPGSFHGTGCTLASSIAVFVAQGFSIGDAVQEAQQYTWDTLRFAFQSGKGQMTPNRFYWMFNESDEGNDEPQHH